MMGKCPYNCQNQTSDGYCKTTGCVNPNYMPSAHKKGKWIYGEHDVAMCDGYYCSGCGFFVPWDYKREFIDFIDGYNFCPHCGAPMERGTDE